MLLMILKDVISPFNINTFRVLGVAAFQKNVLKSCKELDYSSIKKAGSMKFKN